MRSVSQPTLDVRRVRIVDALSRLRARVCAVSTAREVWLLAAAAALVLATRLPFLPTTLEDLDSVNFHLGVHRFYPFADRPHPPGFPVFIAVAKLVHPLFESHASGLAFPSALFSAILLIPLYALCRHLVGRAPAAVACAFVLFNPLVWLNSVRPMSDLTGFGIAVGAQALLAGSLLAAPASRARLHVTWYAGVVLAALAIGVRVQAALLVGPVLVAGFIKRRDARVRTMGLFAAACAAWFVPTVAASGGLRRHLFRQAQIVGEAWPIEPLVSQLTAGRVARGLADVFVAPWGSAWFAAVMLLGAAAGLVLLWRSRPRAVGVILMLFGPYALYNYTLQSTSTLRYSIPIVPLIAVPAALCAASLVRRRVPALAALVAVFALASGRVTIPALSAYAGQLSPPAAALAYLRAIGDPGEPPVVAGNFVFDRYLPELAPAARIIATKPHQEWRALNRFWVAGGDRAIWFLRDPSRSILRLNDPGAQTRVARWTWPAPVMRFLSAARPNQIELVRLDRPRWFAESGFLLTPEAGPPHRVAREPHLLFARSDATPYDLIVSGTAPPGTDITVLLDGAKESAWRVSDHFSLRVNVPSRPTGDVYVPVRFEASAPLLLTGVSLDEARHEFAMPITGFYAPERDDAAREFRWMGPNAAIALPASSTPVRLTIRGVVPVEHYQEPVALLIDSPAGRRAYRLDNHEFVVRVDVPSIEAGETTILKLTTMQAFVPDEREKNGDRRTLSLRIYEMDVERLADADADLPDIAAGPGRHPL